MEGVRAAGSAPGEHRGRVLVVDDESGVRRLLLQVFQSANYETHAAGDSDEALALVSDGAFDVVVSDVHMPGIDGVELVRCLHEIDPDLPVVLLSGAPDLRTALKAVEYGAFAYVAKPVDVDQLLRSAERAIDAHRLRREEREALLGLRTGEHERTLRAVDVRPGTLLGGRYRLGAMIGEGGMGAVYDAVREDSGTPVALKVLHGGIDRAGHLSRFRREAETVARLDHPNIVRVFDFQAAGEEPPFLVMERLQGASLAQILARQGRLSLTRAARMAHQVLDALSALHSARVIHRDLKPANVFLTFVPGKRETVKLLDFGIAKLLETTPEQKLTQTGVVVGTPAYMAPEHARGAPVDSRCDVYAVGCVLYEALAARPAFQAANYHAVLFAVQEAEPVPLGEIRPDVAPEFIAIVKRAMAKDPAERFQTAADMRRAVAPWAGEPATG